ncbi:uncharacterized protein LOC123695011 [Colias croceus]|uniref:uncharacterized protein LOC123695011 n=1 Tax=Colias crocea TaxID=72248 RepID=UPI001E27FF20|nr:uncharacterized protein LOC123695011 [Colias croceus]
MPKVLESAAREVIFKVKLFCEAEKKNKDVLIPIMNVMSRVAAMTGVSKQIVSKIIKEDNIVTKRSSKNESHGKSRPHAKKKVAKKIRKKKVVEKDIAQSTEEIITLPEAAYEIIIPAESSRQSLDEQCQEGTFGTINSTESGRDTVSDHSNIDNDKKITVTRALSDHNYL